jgi:signal transduction histidine kinase
MRRFRTRLAWFWYKLGIYAAVSVGCALFFSTAYREPLGTDLIDTLCITAFISGFIAAGRYGLARLLPKASTGHPDVQQNWPGWRFMGPWIVVSAVVGFIAGRALGHLITGGRDSGESIFQDPRLLLVTICVVLVISFGTAYFFYIGGRIAAAEAREQAAMRTAAENQLKLLASQLEPHMLFNTLANLRVLIAHDAPRAQAMLDHLIGFLRATLEASRSGSSSLSKEFSRVGDYLELMQIRMGPRLNRQLDLPAELASLPVPPLVLQPLVENAIKHGLEPTVKGGWIVVSARREDRTLVLTVRDTGAGLAPLATSGTHFGLQQVRERLAALYGGAGTLELKSVDDGHDRGTLAIVRLPLS